MNTDELTRDDDHAPAGSEAPQGEVLVRVENGSKRFCRDLKKSLWYGVQDIAGEVFPFGYQDTDPSAAASRKLRKDEFWAVRDVSFELRRGECMALIGRNGAGKTTLLKMLNGLIKPDHGKIEMRGRVGAMIALGAGFNPVLSGRENVYVTGSIRGMSKKEIDDRIEDIIDFAEIREFIDMPVQSYSSGMQVRLGFSVASALSPDIMLIDEVLAVGDAAFRFKCLKRIAELRKTTAMILVSHNMQQIGIACNRGLVINRGKVVEDGTTQRAIEVYEGLNAQNPEKASDSVRRVAPPLLSADLTIPERVQYGEGLEASLDFETAEPLEDLYVLCKFFDVHEQTAAEISSHLNPVGVAAGKNCLKIRSDGIFLKPGNYLVNVTLYSVSSPVRLAWFFRIHHLKVEGVRIQRQASYQIRAAVKLENKPA